jgi:hypothetical protein
MHALTFWRGTGFEFVMPGLIAGCDDVG